ncbi:hypothetical protein EWE75_05195 [Sphingomonas populi]|uniref:Uncharacterized protein n=1 Tax=Sphingomonas populi TaxID=2484750 RepID=A0A4V2DDP3_9SPHN|nr:hypothetical protein [Sphingomonas populi]RZF65688.1 hypothetical protein EWE75_05195 [Sphingomonas populi]
MKPLCAVLGHRRSRRRVWHDHVDLRALCVRCGTPLIRSVDKGWRAFVPSDDHPDRISRESYREQMKREAELHAAGPHDPEQWARLLIATLGDPARAAAANPATIFERLIVDLQSEPAFVEAVVTGRLDLPARAAVGSACGRLIGAPRPLPLQFVDPLARYLFARAQSAQPGTPQMSAVTQT